MSLGMCVHTCLWGGNGWVKIPAQYLVSVYLFKSVVASKGTTAHVCAGVCWERVRNALPEHNCLNTSPSAVSPLPSRGNNLAWILFFHHTPRYHLTLPRGRAWECPSVASLLDWKSACRCTNKPVWEPKEMVERLEENTSLISLFFFFFLLPTGSTCNPSPPSWIGVVTSGINVLGRFN